MSRASNLQRSLNLGFSMQNYLGKLRLHGEGHDNDNQHASDGYYVFVTLICIVLTITTAIVVTFGIEMLR